MYTTSLLLATQQYWCDSHRDSFTFLKGSFSFENRCDEKNLHLGNLHPWFYQGSLHYPFWGDQTVQINGDFEGFPL